MAGLKFKLAPWLADEHKLDEMSARPGRRPRRPEEGAARILIVRPERTPAYMY